MKVPLYIAIYALLITLCSMKSNNTSNKTPEKKVYYKLIQKHLGISISDRTSGPLLWQNHQISTFPDYCKLRLISSVLIHLRQGFTVGLISEAGLHLRGIITSRTRKSASKQAIAVLIKVLFAFTGFKLSVKSSEHIESRENELDDSLLIEFITIQARGAAYIRGLIIGFCCCCCLQVDGPIIIWGGL